MGACALLASVFISAPVPARETGWTRIRPLSEGLVAPNVVPGLVALCLGTAGLVAAAVSRSFRRELLPPPHLAGRAVWGVPGFMEGTALAVGLVALAGRASVVSTGAGPLPGLGWRILASHGGGLAASAAIVAVLRARWKATWADLGLVLRRPAAELARGAAGYLVSFPLAVAGVRAGQLLGGALGLGSPVHPVMEELAGGATGAEAFALVAGAVILGPVVEEFLFRGFLYSTLKGLLGMRAALLLSALLFGALHEGPAAMTGTAALGAALALLYERSGSLIAPVTAHALFNATQIAQVLL